MAEGDPAETSVTSHHLLDQIKALEAEIESLDERLEQSSPKGASSDSKAADEYRQQAQRSLFRNHKQSIHCPVCHKSSTANVPEELNQHRCPSCRALCSVRWANDSTLAIRLCDE